MPEGAMVRPQPSVTVSRQQTPESKAPTPPRISPFPAYEVPEDEVRTGTPDPIKVTRSKKKGPGKKKRT